MITTTNNLRMERCANCCVDNRGGRENAGEYGSMPVSFSRVSGCWSQKKRCQFLVVSCIIQQTGCLTPLDFALGRNRRPSVDVCRRGDRKEQRPRLDFDAVPSYSSIWLGDPDERVVMRMLLYVPAIFFHIDFFSPTFDSDPRSKRITQLIYSLAPVFNRFLCGWVWVWLSISDRRKEKSRRK